MLTWPDAVVLMFLVWMVAGMVPRRTAATVQQPERMQPTPEPSLSPSMPEYLLNLIPTETDLPLQDFHEWLDEVTAYWMKRGINMQTRLASPKPDGGTTDTTTGA